RQNDRGVEADNIFPAGDHRTPPLALDVLLQLDAERTVVPRRFGASVDLTARVDQTPALGEVGNGVHLRLGCHARYLHPLRVGFVHRRNYLVRTTHTVRETSLSAHEIRVAFAFA